MSNEAAAFTPSRAPIEQGLRGTTVADAVLIAQQYLRAGMPRGALMVCEVAEALGMSGVSLTVCEATARLILSDGPGAQACLERVRAVAPNHAAALHVEASLMLAGGYPRKAQTALERLVAMWPDYPGALAMLATLLLPGPPYREVLARLHAMLRPQRYLEVGVDTGATLALATTAKIAAGVDPAPPPDPRGLPKSAICYQLESDAFFARESIGSVFGGAPVDLAFVDGMHLVEYALRDFANVERWCTPQSTIVLHDCLPPTPIAAARVRATMFWVGDVWKVLDVLLEHRPDLCISVVPTPPSGLVVVRGLDPNSTVLRDRYDDIVSRYRDMAYPHTPGAWPSRYPIVTNDPAGIDAALAR
jgi:hypothetical protein